jgi:hypothetical protein
LSGWSVCKLYQFSKATGAACQKGQAGYQLAANPRIATICHSAQVRLKSVHGGQRSPDAFRSVTPRPAVPALDGAFCTAAPSIIFIPRPLLGDLVHSRPQMYSAGSFSRAALNGTSL